MNQAINTTSQIHRHLCVSRIDVFIHNLEVMNVSNCLQHVFLTVFIMSSIVTPALSQKSQQDTLLEKLFSQDTQFEESIREKDKLNIQVIYTAIDRNKKGEAKFTDHRFNVEPENYFYPASTVKFPVVILALQKLNELKIPGLDRNTTMITEAENSFQSVVCNDPSAADGRPTIAQYIKRILLVSDNDAFNRLYEFLGQEYINNTLHKMGYTKAQIIHRLSISLPDEENRFTNPVKFFDNSGNLIYTKPAERSQLVYDIKGVKLGKGYMQGAKLIPEPFDFSMKNRLLLEDLHSMIKSIMFPDEVPDKKRFNLKKEDYEFLRKYMSMRPAESGSPAYDSTVYWDNYVKMIFYGAEKSKPEDGIRIFNKTGTAYGFLTDVCYLADFNNGIEFFVSATIYCNSDEIFNDDKYDYSTIGYPFLKTLGRAIYEYELKRVKKYKPDLSAFRFDYRF